MPTDRRSCRNGYPPVGGAHCCHCLYELSARDLHFCSPPKSLFRRVIFVLCRTGRVDFSAFCQLLQKQRENFVHHHIAPFLFSCCAIIILSASSFVNAKMRLVISQFEGMLRIIWSAIPISFTFPVRSKTYMASAHGTIVQSILHYKNWSHSPLYAFRFSDI